MLTKMTEVGGAEKKRRGEDEVASIKSNFNTFSKTRTARYQNQRLALQPAKGRCLKNGKRDGLFQGGGGVVGGGGGHGAKPEP